MRIGLDVDGVLAGFVQGFIDRGRIRGLGDRFPATVEEWVTYDAPDRGAFDQIWNEIENDRSFWLGLPPIMDPKSIPFKVDLYCTSRPVPTEVTSAWLFAHGFPDGPVSTVPYGTDKGPVLAENKIDAFVDDNVKNYNAINAAGVTCYLWDTPSNRHYVLGGTRRIFDLKGVVIGPRRVE